MKNPLFVKEQTFVGDNNQFKNVPYGNTQVFFWVGLKALGEKIPNVFEGYFISMKYPFYQRGETLMPTP